MKNKRLNGNTKHKHASSIFSRFLSMTGFNRIFDTFFPSLVIFTKPKLAILGGDLSK